MSIDEEIEYWEERLTETTNPTEKEDIKREISEYQRILERNARDYICRNQGEF